MRAAFARILVELRKKRKLTQEDIAFESGYSTKYIGQLEPAFKPRPRNVVNAA